MPNYSFPDESEELRKARQEMVNHLKRQKLVTTEKLSEAMLTIPRHLFVPSTHQRSAYIDSPLSIGEGQTISAPHMNAMMCEYLDLKEGQKVLEIGTGSGYHAALLSHCVGDSGFVYTVERIPSLAKSSSEKYQKFNFTNVQVIHSDGTLGYSEKAPYDRILVTAAAPKIPDELMKQLSPDGGILCIPVAAGFSYGQNLLVITKNGDKIDKKNVCSVVFVPLIGKDGYDER